MNQKYTFAFWGTGPLAESTIYSLYKSGLIPKYIITKPDSKIGRDQILTSPIIKTWAESKNIIILQPETLKEDLLAAEFKNFLNDENIDFHIIASYGKILPEYIFKIKNIKNSNGKNIKYTPLINVHPSDLPELRGPSPVQYALLRGDREITVTIMEMDKGVDSGNIIIKNKIQVENDDNLEKILRKCGNIAGDMIKDIIELYISGNIKTIKQNHSEATFTKFINKEEGNITDLLNQNKFLITKKIESLFEISNIDFEKIKDKYRAMTPWPGLYFFIHDKNNIDIVKFIRIKITKFNPLAKNLVEAIESIIPESKKEVNFKIFLENLK